MLIGYLTKRKRHCGPANLDAPWPGHHHFCYQVRQTETNSRYTPGQISRKGLLLAVPFGHVHAPQVLEKPRNEIGEENKGDVCSMKPLSVVSHSAEKLKTHNTVKLQASSKENPCCMTLGPTGTGAAGQRRPLCTEPFQRGTQHGLATIIASSSLATRSITSHYLGRVRVRAGMSCGTK